MRILTQSWLRFRTTKPLNRFFRLWTAAFVLVALGTLCPEMAKAQSPQVIVTGGSSNGQTLDFSGATNNTLLYDLSGATAINFPALGLPTNSWDYPMH